MTAMSAPAASALVANPARRGCPLNTLASKPANSALAFTIYAREQCVSLCWRIVPPLVMGRKIGPSDAARANPAQWQEPRGGHRFFGFVFDQYDYPHNLTIVSPSSAAARAYGTTGD